MIPCPSSLCFVAPVPLSAPVAFVIVLAAFANASPRYRNPGPFHRKLWNGPKWPYLWFLNDSPFTWSGWNGGRRIHVQLNILSAYLFTVYTYSKLIKIGWIACIPSMTQAKSLCFSRSPCNLVGNKIGRSFISDRLPKSLDCITSTTST